MSDFFTNLIDRHLGTRNVVEPRTPSRFETDDVGSAKPLPVDHSGTRETGKENTEREDSVAPLPENNPVGPPFNSIEPQRIDPEVKLPFDHTDPGDAMDDNLERQDNLIRSPANDSISVDVNAPEMEHHIGIPVLRQQDRQSFEPKPVEQTNPKEENVPLHVIHRHSTVETEGQRTLPGDIPNPLSGMNPTGEANALTSETGYRFEGELENRIRNMLDRLQDRRYVRPAEHPERNNSDRSVVAEPDYPGNIDKDRAAPPLLVSPVLDKSGQAGPLDSDQGQQQAIASTDRDMPGSGSLVPPSWLTEMQTEFNQRWNELNSKSKPEPVINVTIGRVEVRAVKHETPKQNKSQKKPTGVMSLDEYLKQRERRA